MCSHSGCCRTSQENLVKPQTGCVTDFLTHCAPCLTGSMNMKYAEPSTKRTFRSRWSLYFFFRIHRLGDLLSSALLKRSTGKKQKRSLNQEFAETTPPPFSLSSLTAVSFFLGDEVSHSLEWTRFQDW